MKKDQILLGAHVSISGGIYKAIIRGKTIGATAIQIFVKSSRSWAVKKLTPEEIDLFKNTQKNSPIKIVVAHSSYLINIGSNKASAEKKSITALAEELEICENLGIPYLVLHPGSHLGAGEESCIEKIAKNLDVVLQKIPGKTMILLETTAGQGTNVGYTFKQLEQIHSGCKEKKRIGVCLDTCHTFASGYDLTPKGYENTLQEFDKILGLKLLKVIHLNDSKSELGSKVDRHANIGEGKIPLQTFKLIMNDKRFTDIPKILETPVHEEAEYIKEIKLLKSMV